VFSDASKVLAEGLETLIAQLRSGELPPDELGAAVADLRAHLSLDGAEDYFLARLSYPYLKPEDAAEYVAAAAGGIQHSEMVVTHEDSEGQPYQIRHALSAKEVGRLHRMFLAAKLQVQFRPEHRFLVAVDERGNLLGGLFYEEQPEDQTAHMEKIVVAERFQGRGIAAALIEEVCNRLRSAGCRSLTTGFFRPQFFYRMGFTVERRYAGLVRSLVDEAGETS
jgi:GNAT superfamily N-acetyltransferase